MPFDARSHALEEELFPILYQRYLLSLFFIYYKVANKATQLNQASKQKNASPIEYSQLSGETRHFIYERSLHDRHQCGTKTLHSCSNWVVREKMPMLDLAPRGAKISPLIIPHQKQASRSHFCLHCFLIILFYCVLEEHLKKVEISVS